MLERHAEGAVCAVAAAARLRVPGVEPAAGDPAEEAVRPQPHASFLLPAQLQSTLLTTWDFCQRHRCVLSFSTRAAQKLTKALTL